MINPSSYKKFPNAGLPNKRGGRGNLIVFFEVEFPKSLTKKQQSAIKAQRWKYKSEEKTEL